MFSCVKQLYFIADPYWETATDVGFWQIRRMGLNAGYFVHIIPTTDETQWLRPEDEDGEDENDLEKTTSLKIILEDLLSDGYKVLLSPYWLRNLEEQTLEFSKEFSNGQLVLIDAVSRNPKIQTVCTDLEAGYHQMGQIAKIFMQQHPERQQTIAMFYRGSSYDKYYQSFVEGFKSQGSPAAKSLATQRYYAAEVNELNLAMEKIDASANLIVLGLAQLSRYAYRKLSSDENSLFMVENFGDSQDIKQQILLSLDTDYRPLVQAAIQLEPLTDAQDIRQADDERIHKEPYLLHLPNPELLSGIEQVKAQVQEAVEQRQRKYKRLDRRIARLWHKFIDFATNFRPSDIPWPSWLRNWF